MKIALAGVGLNILGSALLVAATGALALPLLITGRALQGFAAACIMPSTMALLKAYWDGPARQRAVSMWSIGSWGGSGLAAVFGGGVVASLGWRWIFVISIAVSVLAFFLIVGTPENKPAAGQGGAFDYLGLILFVAGTLSVMVILIFGQGLGWASPTVIALGALAIASFFFFIRWERQRTNPFIDLSLFRNTTFTGATISNFLLNCTIGILIVSQQLLQLAGQKADGSAFTAWDAGVLTIGYGVFIIGFIRVGEKLLQRFGPPQAHGLGLPDRDRLDRPAHADRAAGGSLRGAGGDRLLPVRPRSRLLRHAVHRRRPLQPSRRQGGLGLRHLQDGFVTGKRHGGRRVPGRVHGHGRDPLPAHRRRDRVPGAYRQPGPASGGDGRPWRST